MLKSRKQTAKGVEEIDLTEEVNQDDGYITLTLPKSQKVVKLLPPVLGHMIDIERNHKNIGQIEQSLILLTKVITAYGEKSSVTVDTLAKLPIEDLEALNSAYINQDVELDYDIGKTPNDDEAIFFNLSNGTEVVMIRPSVLHLLAVERELNRKYKGAGEMQNMALLFTKLIVNFGNEGQATYQDLLDLSINDWGLITSASSIFFRS